MVMPLDVGIRIPEDESVRVLMKIAERMNYSKLSGAYERECEPREATPKQLFLLVVLGFMNGMYSTRKIEAACRYDIRFMWILCGKKVPDHTRIARFIQRISGEILEDLFYQIVHLLKEDGEIEYAHLFVDGTKIEANANRYTYVYRGTVEKALEKLEATQSAFVKQLRTVYAFELADIEKPKKVLETLEQMARKQELTFVHGAGKKKPTLQKQIEKLREMQEKEAKYQENKRIMGSRNSYSKTDTSATFMRMKDDHLKKGQLKPGYNVQLGIEGEYIVGVDVSSDQNDLNALIPLLERMEEKGKVKHQDVTTDSGYESEETYVKMEERGQTAYIKPKDHEIRKKKSFQKNPYRRENMAYDAKKNSYTCPAGKELTFQGNEIRKTKTGYERTVSIYRAESCAGCPHKDKCTKAKEARSIEVSWTMEKYRAESRERIASEQGILLRVNRSIQSEGAFGVLKEDHHFRRLARRGTKAVFAEILLYAIAYNVKKLHAKTQQNRLKTMLLQPDSA